MAKIEPLRTFVHRLGLAAAAVVVLMLAAGPARAQTTPFDLQSFYRTDLRALAMGNAFTPVARGEAALLYNPAGLVQYNFDIKADLSLAVQAEAGGFLKDTLNVAQGSPTSQQVQDYLTKYDGTPPKYYSYDTFANVVANLQTFNIGVGAGALKQERYGMQFVDVGNDGFTPATDQLFFRDQRLNMKLISFGFQIFGGKLVTGATIKNFTYEDNTTNDTFQNIITSGNVKLTAAGPKYKANAYDVGFFWRVSAAPVLRAQIGLVANNVGGLTLQDAAFPGVDQQIPGTYDLGISINPQFGPLHLLISASQDDITGQTKGLDPNTGLYDKRTTAQRLHLGAEFGLWQTSTGNNVLNFRVGSNRGQSSYGLELNLFSFFRVIYTRYKDDFGNQNGKDVHDFQAAQVTFGIGF